MTTPRRRMRAPDPRDAERMERYWALLNDEALPENDSNSWLAFLFDFDIHDLRTRLWKEHGAAVLEQWAVRSPGTRPSTWWYFDAPSARARLGGRGTPAYVMESKGMPCGWIMAAFDPSDPPTFESEAAYLRRLGLLLPLEAGRIDAVDFEPEVLPASCWPTV